MKMAIVGWNM